MVNINNLYNRYYGGNYSHNPPSPLHWSRAAHNIKHWRNSQLQSWKLWCNKTHLHLIQNYIQDSLRSRVQSQISIHGNFLVSRVLSLSCIKLTFLQSKAYWAQNITTSSVTLLRKKLCRQHYRPPGPLPYDYLKSCFRSESSSHSTDGRLQPGDILS